ncbi:EpsG family protein [uncultured Draconibacterium sp.]|uniref:EpsG family protein n=1 Tax=uncultured Draconibacterium sp. TaxID=1573823 RepID=UPI0029C7B968|nr:EpsG family protein [uncultured Draconibacterium sp.]
MIYFILLISLTILSGLLYESRLISKRAACTIISVFAIILFGIRTENVGNVDVPRYVDSYELLKSIDISQVSHYFVKDPGFYYCSKVFSMLFPSPNLWFAAIGALFILSTSSVIFKFSNNLILSYLLFFTFFFTLNFSLLRHCCAFTFVINGYIALREDKKKKSILMLFLAMLFHLSAIIAFIMIPLKKIKFGLWNILMIVAASMITIIVPDLLTRILAVLNLERLVFYVKNDVMTLTMTALVINSILFAVVLLLILLRSKVTKNKYSFELNMFSVGIAIYALVGILAEFYRAAMFFSFVLIILLPNVINEYKKSINKVFIYTGGFILCIMLLAYFFFIVLKNHELLPFEVINIV